MIKCMPGMKMNFTDEVVMIDGEAYVMDQKEYREYRAKQMTEELSHLYIAMRDKDWDEACSLALLNPWMYSEIFPCFDEMPDENKVKLAFGAYVSHGDSASYVRSAVRKCAHLPQTPKLPPDLAKQKTVTVYRAGEEDMAHAKYRLSWTTDKRVAYWFHNLYWHKHSGHVWQAELTPGDEIAFLTSRNESEVLQYRKVKNIIDITDEAETEQARELALEYRHEHI